MAENHVCYPKIGICLSVKVSQIILPEIWNLIAQNRILFLQIVGLILV